MAWIELHDHNDGRTLHINTKYISCVNKSLVYTGAATVSFVGDSGDYIHVRESVDEVMRMIKEAESISYIMAGV